MRLRHIEVFHANKQTGSISKAAALLGVSQPAASKVIHHTEAALGFKLFKRVKQRSGAREDSDDRLGDCNAGCRRRQCHTARAASHLRLPEHEAGMQ